MVNSTAINDDNGRYDDNQSTIAISSLQQNIAIPLQSVVTAEITGNNNAVPQFKDQVNDCATIIPIDVAHNGISDRARSVVNNNRPSYKDQILDTSPNENNSTSDFFKSYTREIQIDKLETNTPIAFGPDYKDQARSHHNPFPSGLSQITEENSIRDLSDGISSGAHPSPNGSTFLPTNDRSTAPELVSAHLVSESLEINSYPKAEVIDTRKERSRIVLCVVFVIVVILIIVLIPTYLLAIKESSTMTSTNDALSPISITNRPSLSPSISLYPSTSPTAYERFIPLGDPILTDLLDDQRMVVSLSSNGTIIAVGTNNTIQIYEQQTTSVDDKNYTLWIPLGLPLFVDEPLIVDKSDYHYGIDGYFTFHLAPEALVLIVGIPTYQDYSGRVDVYEYNVKANMWITRGDGRVGNFTDQLGYQVVLSLDGYTMGIAASNYDSGNSYAEILTWNITTNVWHLLGRINGLSGAPDLSIDISITYSGSRIILGDPSDGIVGRAVMYECTEDDGCTQLGMQLEGPDYEDYFGYDVSIVGDLIAVASPGSVECYIDCANVKVYEYGRGSEAVWTLVGQELLGNLGFGTKIKLSTSNTLAVLNVTEPYIGDEIIETWTYLYSYGQVWEEIGVLKQAPLLDMSLDGNIFATGKNGSVVLYALTN
jgi:hypothetical protein